MLITLKGVIRGKSIELENETGMPDGQSVDVQLTKTASATLSAKLLRAFGTCSDDPAGVDEFVRETYELRKTSSRRDIEP